MQNQTLSTEKGFVTILRKRSVLEFCSLKKYYLIVIKSAQTIFSLKNKQKNHSNLVKYEGLNQCTKLHVHENYHLNE